MFIPRYWSEASHPERLPDGRPLTIRRFGWSSDSQEAADVHARQRVEQAAAALREGGPEALRGFTRRERKVAYAGSDGLPIREEIVQEWEAADVVVTRNSYGALCLNTTRAMFVDVDRPLSSAAGFGCIATLVGAVAGAVAGPLLLGLHWLPSILAGAGLFAGLGMGLVKVKERGDLRRQSPLRWAVARAQAWCEEHPDWRVVAYETPAGARLLPTHATFDAADARSYAFMDFVEADPLYRRMCRLQKCFRARVSPKPWRAGVTEHFRAGGVWPVADPAKLEARAAWVAKYERRAGHYASCRLAETVGTGRADPRVEEIRRLHDEMCRADSRLEIA